MKKPDWFCCVHIPGHLPYYYKLLDDARRLLSNIPDAGQVMRIQWRESGQIRDGTKNVLLAMIDRRDYPKN